MLVYEREKIDKKGKKLIPPKILMNKIKQETKSDIFFIKTKNRNLKFLRNQ